MNWAGSLGVSPALLVLESGRTLVAFAEDDAPPILVKPTREQVPRKPREYRTREESAALKARIEAAIGRGEDRAEIAVRENVTPAWVDAIARAIGKSRQRLTHERLAALADEARAMRLGPPAMKQREVAAALGLSPANLGNILKRYPPKKTPSEPVHL